MLSKGIEKRCAVYSSVRTSPSSQVGIIDAPASDACAYQAASADTRMRANASDYVCDRLRKILASSACVLYARTRVYTHARSSASRARQGRNFTPVGETASHERENYCTTRDLSLIINTPTSGTFF